MDTQIEGFLSQYSSAQFAVGAGSPPSSEEWRTSSRRRQQGGNKMEMKTTKELRQMKYDELRREATVAYQYWQKVLSFRDVAKHMEEFE